MGIEGFHSVIGRNVRLLQSRFKMDKSNVFKFCNPKCDNESDAVRLSIQVRELCRWRDKCNCTKLLLTFYVMIEFFNCLTFVLKCHILCAN